MITALSVMALFGALVNAQAPVGTPPFTGKLLIQPGLATPQCLTATLKKDGAPVTLQPCTNAASQQWEFKNGQLQTFGGAMCLDNTNGVQSNGNKLQVWSCAGSSNKNQQWYYTWWSNELSLTGTNLCMDLPSGNTATGQPIQLWNCAYGNPNQIWNAGYSADALPNKSVDGQTGINNCGTGSSQNSMCQTAWINDMDDFCLFAPPSPQNIGDSERYEVAYCTKKGRGTRTIPEKTLTGVHFVKTPSYVQVTGTGDFTKINVPKGDYGGELDPHGYDGKGNPMGGLVYGNSFSNKMQYHEWTTFISDSQFCFRACTGRGAPENCQHIYDEMGCNWNMPANYDSGVFESCKGDNDLPMGVYGTSTWHQGTSPTPSAHPAASSSECHSSKTITLGTASVARRGFKTEVARAEPTMM